VALTSNMNPIRKVVTLLQDMQKKVTAEGEAEQELYEKFMCYCKSGTSDLSASIESAEKKMPQVTADITASEEASETAKADLAQAQDERAAAKTAIEEATAIRQKEAATFAAMKAEIDTNTAAIAKAIAALEKGMAGGFLQTPSASKLKNILNSDKVELPEGDRSTVIGFLEGTYAPSSGEVTGILKQMGDTMAAGLAEDTKAEEEAIKTFDALVAAKEKEIKALSATVESKTAEIGELGVTIVQLKEDLDDTSKTYSEDKKFLSELETSCSTKTSEWEERSKTRAEELVALADTIKVLNDDDALDLFKKTLPSPGAQSLMQIGVSRANQREQALSLIRRELKGRSGSAKPDLELIALALAGKRSMDKGAFDKVIKMCDDLVDVLKKEQLDDDNKKEYCESQFDVSDDNMKALDRTLAQEETAIASAKEGIASLTQEIKALEAGIKALDKSVAEATEQRKAENVEYKELMTSDSAAVELLGFAKNRLNKFYNPKLYKPPAEQELSAEDKIFTSMGGTPPPTEAPGGIAGTGIEAFVQISAHNHMAAAAATKEAPAPPPATWSAYAKKSEESNGVISMIDLLIKDLTKEMTEAETEEKEAQADYKTLMADAAEKRTADSASLTEKTGAKADLEADLMDHESAHQVAVKEMMALQKYIASLHAECDWLLKFFDVRKTARSEEIEALGRAKAVLSGADYSLLQLRTKGFLARHSQ